MFLSDYTMLLSKSFFYKNKKGLRRVNYKIGYKKIILLYTEKYTSLLFRNKLNLYTKYNIYLNLYVSYHNYF